MSFLLHVEKGMSTYVLWYQDHDQDLRTFALRLYKHHTVAGLFTVSRQTFQNWLHRFDWNDRRLLKVTPPTQDTAVNFCSAIPCDLDNILMVYRQILLYMTFFFLTNKLNLDCQLGRNARMKSPETFVYCWNCDKNKHTMVMSSNPSNCWAWKAGRLTNQDTESFMMMLHWLQTLQRPSLVNGENKQTKRSFAPKKIILLIIF